MLTGSHIFRFLLTQQHKAIISIRTLSLMAEENPPVTVTMLVEFSERSGQSCRNTGTTLLPVLGHWSIELSEREKKIVIVEREHSLTEHSCFYYI